MSEKVGKLEVPDGFAEVTELSKQLRSLAESLGALKHRLEASEPVLGLMAETASALTALASASLVSPNAVPSALLACVVSSRVAEDQDKTSSGCSALVSKMIGQDSRRKTLHEMASSGVDHYLALQGESN